MISETIIAYGLGGQSGINAQHAKNYIDFIKQHLRLCCQIQPHKVFSVVERMIKRKGSKGTGNGGYYPIEDCLAICQDHNQIESSFLLNKKLGKYFDAVSQGLTIMRTKVDYKKVKIELYYAKKTSLSTNFCISSAQMSECRFFDSIFKRVYGILSKHGKEVEADKEQKIWYLAIDALLDLKQNEAVILKAYCRRFFQQRLNLLVEAMSRTVPFRQFLEHALSRYQDTQFKEFQDLILQIVLNQNSEEIMLGNANSAISKVNNILFESFQQTTKFGVLFRQRQCNICKRYLNKSWHEEDFDDVLVNENEDDEDASDPMTDELVKVFACSHSFHVKCLKRNYRKLLSPSVFDEIYQKVGCNRLRCPICNIISFDLEGGTNNQKSAFAHPSKIGVQNARQNNRMPISQQNGPDYDENEELNKYRVIQEKKAQLRISRRETRMVTIASRRYERMERHMSMFDSLQKENGLTLNNFGKVKQGVFANQLQILRR